MMRCARSTWAFREAGRVLRPPESGVGQLVGITDTAHVNAGSLPVRPEAAGASAGRGFWARPSRGGDVFG